jgi:hypothetical protein
MATKLTIDVIDDTNFEEVGSGRQINSRGQKLCYVDGIGGDADAQLTALALVQARFIPWVTPYSSRRPWCVPVNYRCEGVAEDSDAIRIRVVFGTPTFQRVQGIPWIIENDTSFEMVSSQVDPVDGTPIELLWISPDDTTVKAKDVMTYSYPQSIRRVTLSGILRFDELVKVRKAIARRVNATPWSGLGKGFWRCVRVSDRVILGQKLTQVRLDIDTREDEDWSTYGILKDQRDGKYKANPSVAKKLRKAEYKYGVQNTTGGVAKVGPYKPADFTSALGFNDIDTLNNISATINANLHQGGQ